ncbi:conserved hypothetical protein [Gammaproteobacteria bacterium]
MSSLHPVVEDLPTRRIAWEVLSDLFLDTDVSLSRSWRIEKLAALPYTIAELEQILIDEIYPICKYNLLSVAGVWTGFEPVWLEGEILRRLVSPYLWLHAFNIGRMTVPMMLEWCATKTGIVAIRDAAYKSISIR